MSHKLLVKDPRGQREILLVGTMTVGRDPRCDISDADPLLSRRHAEFVVSDAGVLVRDLNSRNGILVNGRKTPQAVLQPGDVVQVAGLAITLISTVPKAPPTPTSGEPSEDKTVLVTFASAARTPGTLSVPAAAVSAAALSTGEGAAGAPATGEGAKPEARPVSPEGSLRTPATERIPVAPKPDAMQAEGTVRIPRPGEDRGAVAPSPETLAVVRGPAPGVPAPTEGPPATSAPDVDQFRTVFVPRTAEPPGLRVPAGPEAGSTPVEPTADGPIESVFGVTPGSATIVDAVIPALGLQKPVESEVAKAVTGPPKPIESDVAAAAADDEERTRFLPRVPRVPRRAEAAPIPPVPAVSEAAKVESVPPKPSDAGIATAGPVPPEPPGPGGSEGDEDKTRYAPPPGPPPPDLMLRATPAATPPAAARAIAPVVTPIRAPSKATIPWPTRVMAMTIGAAVAGAAAGVGAGRLFPESGMALILAVVVAVAVAVGVAILLGRAFRAAMRALADDLDLAVIGRLDQVGDPFGEAAGRELGDAMNELIARVRTGRD